jgi:hypothetical protein
VFIIEAAVFFTSYILFAITIKALLNVLGFMDVIRRSIINYKYQNMIGDVLEYFV